MRQILKFWKQDYDDIATKHSSNIKLTHLEDMTFGTNPEIPPSSK